MWSHTDYEMMVGLFAFGLMVFSSHAGITLFWIGLVAFIVLCAEIFFRHLVQ